MIGFVRDVIRVLRMPCRRHTELFTRQLDERLSAGVSAGLRLHVLYCTGCARFRRQVRLLHDLARRVGDEAMGSEKMPEHVRQRVLSASRDEGNGV